MPTLWIYRHAESLSNAGAKTLEPAGIPLTEHGLAQAEALAETVERRPDVILTSPFRRAIDTARPIRRRFPHARDETWRIQEFTYLNPVACVGTSWMERKPMIDAYWARLDPDHVDGDGAESFNRLLMRARTFLRDVARLEASLIIAVSHGQFMQAARLVAEHPDLSPQEAMRVFVERQAVPFLNCERLEFTADGKWMRHLPRL